LKSLLRRWMMLETVESRVRVRGSAASARLVLALACLAFAWPGEAPAAREAKVQGADMEAQRLLDKAGELLDAGEKERGVRMLETVLEQFPTSRVRYPAYLALGKYYLKTHEQIKAIAYLANLKSLESSMNELAAEERNIYVEGMFLMGTAYFQVRNYGAAFPILRKITSNFPNTMWANQSYYYIGMCHFVQQNWSKAIDALNLVGTFIDTDAGGSTDLAEAGRRFYIKVTDTDLPIQLRLGQRIWVDLETSHGDKEKIEAIPLSASGDVMIGSLPTEVGVAKPGDGVLQVLGGDIVTARYTDANTRDGKANVIREKKVRIVAPGSLNITLGDLTTPAPAAYLEQPLGLVVQDADMDTSDAADSVSVKLVARYREQKAKEEDDTPQNTVDLQKILNTETQTVYRTRDELILRLTEGGAAPVHSGRFTGTVVVHTATPERPANTTDDLLSCVEGDEIVATYIDEVNLSGSPRTVQATVSVAGTIDNSPQSMTDTVNDPIVKAKKNIVEATAYLELARIFKGMGLMKGARQKADEGLDRVDFIIRTTSPIPRDLRQNAFKTKWDLFIAADDFESAIATCEAFSRLYPDSPMVDEALMGIAKVHMDLKKYKEATAVLSRILGLPKSQAKAEAQFRIAEISELKAKEVAADRTARPGDVTTTREAAVQQYKLCAERYPDSEFAGQSLSKMVDYYVDQKDYAQANELLARAFLEHPDASFLDAMLLKWVVVAFGSGDYAKAREKCSTLLFDYPDSPYAEKAKQILPKIEQKLSAAAAPAAEKIGE